MGCEKDIKIEKQEERYIESTINLPDDISYITDITILSNDEICIAGAIKKSNKETTACKWKSNNDGIKWEIVTSINRTLLPNAKENIECLAHIYQNGLVCSFGIWCDDYLTGGYAQEIIMNDDNKPKGRRLSNTEGMGTISDMVFGGKDIGYAINTKKSQLYELDFGENKINSICLKNISIPTNIYSQGDNLYIIGNDGATQYDCINKKEIIPDETFEQLSRDVVERGMVGNSMMFSIIDGKEKEYFYASKQGIWKYCNGNNIKIVDGESSELGNGEVAFENNFVAKNDKELYLAVGSLEGPKLLKYTKQADSTNSKDITQIDVYIISENEKIIQMMKSYQRKHPNIKINLEVGIDSYDKTLTDAKKELNTRLMSGEGPDLIILDDMDAKKYIEAGLLKDIANIVGKSDDELFQNIIRPYSSNNKIYGIPTSFSLMVACNNSGRKINVDSFSSIINVMQKENTKFKNRSFDNVSAICFRSYFNQDVEKNKTIIENRLRTFYIDLMKLYAMYDVPVKEKFASFQQLNLRINPLISFRHIEEHQAGVTLDYISSMSALQRLYDMKKRGVIDVTPMISDEKMLFIPEGILGVNSKSKNTDIAQDIVLYMLSDEGQDEITKHGGLAINANVLKNALASMDGFISDDGEKSVKVSELAKEDIENIMEMLRGLNTVSTTDGIVMDMVMSQGEAYLNGDITLFAAVGNASQKLLLYFSE